MAVSNKDIRRASRPSQVFLPVAAGIDNQLARHQGVFPDSVSTPRSRLVNMDPELTPDQPSDWYDPITWVNGAVYHDGTLNQQLRTDTAAIPHAIKTMEEDFVLTTASVYTPVTGLELSFGANEVWSLILTFVHNGQAPSGDFAIGTTQADTVIAAIWDYRTNAGASVTCGLFKQSTVPAPYVRKWGPQSSFDFEPTDSYTHTVPIILTTGAACSIALLMSNDSTAGSTVWAGASWIGAQVI